jgi:hypothetical protein
MGRSSSEVPSSHKIFAKGFGKYRFAGSLDLPGKAAGSNVDRSDFKTLGRFQGGGECDLQHRDLRHQ